MRRWVQVIFVCYVVVVAVEITLNFIAPSLIEWLWIPVVILIISTFVLIARDRRRQDGSSDLPPK
jgi:hypothetical protein